MDPTDARTNWMRHQVAPVRLRAVSCAFAEAGIPVLPVKGVLTAHLLYADVAERPLFDIDLRIRRRDFRFAMRLAQQRGWSPQTTSPVLWTAILQVDGWEVDVEATVGPPGLCALRVEDLLARADRHTDPFGFDHVQPAFDDHALILVLNAFKDGLRPQPWAIEDLRRIANHPRFDEAALVDRARAGRVASALWIVADWLAEREGALPWRIVRDRVGPRPPSRRAMAAYSRVEQRGWPQKRGLFAAAAGSDSPARAVSGLALTAAGIFRRRALLAIAPKAKPQ
jgi:hypothetical protein